MEGRKEREKMGRKGEMNEYSRRLGHPRTTQRSSLQELELI